MQITTSATNGSANVTVNVNSTTAGSTTIIWNATALGITNTTTITTAGPASITLTANRSVAAANGIDAISLTVQLKVTDGTNLSSPGAIVSYAKTSGVGNLTLSSGLTDSSGMNSTTITSGTPGSATIIASVSGLPIATATVTFSGNATTIVVTASPSSTGTNSISTVTAQAFDVNGNNAAIADGASITTFSVTFSTPTTVTLSNQTPASGKFNNTGGASANVTSATAGTYTVTVIGAGLSTSTTVTFSPVVIPTLNVTASSTNVTAGTATDVTFTVTSAGTAVSGATVTLSGNVTAISNTTDASGIAIISVNATGAGTITATANKTGYNAGEIATITAEVAPSSITSVTITPTNPSVGEQINITVSINNPGASFNGRVEGNVWLPDGITGKYLGFEEVVIPSGVSTVTITGTPGGDVSSYLAHTAGNHTYDVFLENVDDGEVWTNATDSNRNVAFTVEAAEIVYMSNISFSSVPTNGSVMTLNVTISNPTGSVFNGTMNANIWTSVQGADGITLDTQSINLTADSSTTLTFSYTPVNTGTYSYDFFMVSAVSGDNTKAPFGFTCMDYLAGIGFEVE